MHPSIPRRRGARRLWLGAALAAILGAFVVGCDRRSGHGHG